MLQKQIDEFITLSADLLPELFEKSKVGDSELYDDYALIHFTLEKGMSVAEIMDCLEDQMEMVILYHHVPTHCTEMGTSCCAYSDHNFGNMFVIHATAGADSLVHQLCVTVYSSPDTMLTRLQEDLHLHERSGTFEYKREVCNLFVDFC